MKKQVVIDSYLGGWSEAQFSGSQGTFNSSIAIDPDYAMGLSDIRTSGMLVPTVYEKFSSSVVAGNVKWLITNPKNTLIYGYSDNPAGTALELNSIGNLITSLNLKAYYRMTSGSITTDSSGQAKTLTNNGTVTTTTGKFGDAITLGTNNSTKSLSIADKLSYAGGAYSISLWAKMETELASDGEIYILASVNDSASDTLLQLVYEKYATVNTVTFRRVQSGTSIQRATLATSLGTSSFHLIVGTYDAGTLRVYVDNVLGTTASSSGSGSTAVTDKFSIGAF